MNSHAMLLLTLVIPVAVDHSWSKCDAEQGQPCLRLVVHAVVIASIGKVHNPVIGLVSVWEAQRVGCWEKGKGCHQRM
jgi:hypothetical protein